MRYKLTTTERLIFRDGRPFGEAGVFGGTACVWPLPQTLLGMVRTRIGFLRDPYYFDDRDPRFEERIEAILRVGIGRILPSVEIEGAWKPLMPVPADMVIIDAKDRGRDLQKAHLLSFEALGEGVGTDIANREWLIPMASIEGKPAKQPPLFLHGEVFQSYLEGSLEEASAFLPHKLGIHGPIREERVHNAISSETGTTEEGKLFSNSGMYMKTLIDGTLCDLSIDFEVMGAASEEISGSAFLGGERKRVDLSPGGTSFPESPGGFDHQRYLKLVLTTHGDFGGWCPGWLCPDLNASTIPWVPLSGLQTEIRLRSACVAGWEGVSGWDHVAVHPETGRKGCPRSMKKLVRPGTVYLIEIKESRHSQQVADYFWGRHLTSTSPTPHEQTCPDGYGQCVVGVVPIVESK